MRLALSRVVDTQIEGHGLYFYQRGNLQVTELPIHRFLFSRLLVLWKENAPHSIRVREQGWKLCLGLDGPCLGVVHVVIENMSHVDVGINIRLGGFFGIQNELGISQNRCQGFQISCGVVVEVCFRRHPNALMSQANCLGTKNKSFDKRTKR